MAETNVSSECGLGGEPGLSRQSVAQGHSGSGKGKYRRSTPMVGQTHIGLPRLGLFQLSRRLSAGSPHQPICEMRTFLCIAGVVIGVSGNPSSSLAEVEEATSQDGFVSEYSQFAFTPDFTTSLASSSSNITGKFDSNHSTFNMLYNGASFRQYNTNNTNTTTGLSYKFNVPANLDDALIPAAVWNLDSSTGVHLDYISGDFGSDLSISLGSHRRTHDLWTRMILGLWVDGNRSDAILLSPPQFQVASCGGTSAEHRDLEFCSFNYVSTNLNADPSKQSGQDNSTDTAIAPALNNSSDTAIESSNSSTPSPSRPDTVLDLSPLLPANVNNFAALSDPLNTLPDQCDDTSASCTITSISLPTAPTALIDAPIAPIDDPTPPDSPPSGPVVPIYDPGPVSDPLPIFTPPPVASPVPETSTEVMTMIGFGIMLLASRGRGLNSIKHGVVEAFYKITKKYLHHYSV